MAEWKKIGDISVEDETGVDIIIEKDGDGNTFEVNEIYGRITSMTKANSYMQLDIAKNVTIGEVRGSTPVEFWIKRDGPYWRVFYITYNGTAYSEGQLKSFAAFHPSYIKTIDDCAAISYLKLSAGGITEMTAEIWGK